MSASAAMAKAEETVTETQFEGFSGRMNLTIRSTAVPLTGAERPAESAEWRSGFSVTRACHPRRHAAAARGSPLANRDAGSNTGLTWRGRRRGRDREPQSPKREVTAAVRASLRGQRYLPLRSRPLALDRCAASPRGL